MFQRVGRITAILAFSTLVSLSLTACGDDDGAPFESPFDGIPASNTIDGDGLTAPVEVVRDEYGIPHIYAQNMADLAYANGYVMASDRIAQMNLFRHAASGNVSRLFGALQPAQIDNDIRMRMHRLRPLAQETWDELTASVDPDDQEIVQYFTRYSDGVNAYVADLAREKYTQDPAIEVFFPTDTFQPWTPVDSLTIGRLQTFVLSYDDYDLRVSNTLQRGATAFPADSGDSGDPDLARRALAAYDFGLVRPMATVAPLDGFPNVAEDSGTHAKPEPGAQVTPRPWIEPAVLEAAVRNGRPQEVAGFDFSQRLMASNNWVVGPQVAGGSALLANDTHLPLISPSIWYLVHLTVPGQIDAQGVGFPGLPALQLGHNQHLAWGATVIVHDVYDFYVEEVAPCSAGGGDCVTWHGAEVAIETWTETIDVGANGTVIDQREITFERVPHHGPIVPDIYNGAIVPRTAGQAITVKYTGHEVTNEVRAVFHMLRASTVAQGMDALDDWNHGGMNWVLADDTGTIGYTGSARIPLRSPGCFTFERSTEEGRRGVAPYMALPGDGSCEWTGFMSDRYMPHTIDPALGYIATANADPVGETFDGDPLNGPIVDGAPLYLGTFYDPGFRVERIYQRLQAIAASGTPATLEDMYSIQADNHSNFGGRMVPFIASAVAKARNNTVPDAAAYFAALSPARQDRLVAAVARLDGWTLETPSAVEGTPSATEIADASATVIFNAWGHFFFTDAYQDELSLIGESVEINFIARTGLALLERPQDLLTGLHPTTNEPVLCDDLATDGIIESCTFIIVRALDRALDFAETHYASADMDDWRWGDLHRLTLSSQLPDANLDVPPASETNPDWVGGYPRHGMTYAVDASNGGWTDLDFDYGDGPAMRHVTQLTPGSPPKTMFALPGGITFDRSSPHFRDLLETYYIRNQYFELPFLIATIVEKAETRWRFVPKR